MLNFKPILAVLIAGSALAGEPFMVNLHGEPVITCEPRELRGVPGHPLQVEITIETDRAVPAQLRIPHIDGLFLRTVEKIPIQRTKEGRYIQKRIVIWQGLEAASLTVTNLTVVFQRLDNVDATPSSCFKPLDPSAAREVPLLRGRDRRDWQKICPTIGIIIDAVEPAKPPAKKEDE